MLEQPAEEYEEQYYEEGDYDYQPEIEYEYTQEELQIANVCLSFFMVSFIF